MEESRKDTVSSVVLLLRSKVNGENSLFSVVVDEDRHESRKWGFPFLAASTAGLAVSNELVLAPKGFFQVRDALLFEQAFAAGKNIANVSVQDIPEVFTVFGMSVRRQRIYSAFVKRSNKISWGITVCEAVTRDPASHKDAIFCSLADFERYGKAVLTRTSYDIWEHFSELCAQEAAVRNLKQTTSGHREGRRLRRGQVPLSVH